MAANISSSPKSDKRPLIWVLHGPNLNMLGKREPEIYGRMTLVDLDQELRRLAETRGAQCESFQSNHEGALIDRIHAAPEQGVDFFIINPGAWTHTSIALRDALLSVALPYIEVHLSNIYARETFRHHSMLSDKAFGGIYGLGARGYEYAMLRALDYLQS
ncbi:MAG: type II 3-dehydroquinate dehydratase [Burkholderiales bacterium]|jgi:3-dehydroquinate dehydratase-2|nr:type II 3-dehydroquinate dehydratase [Burkholderiales bacterium]